MRNNTFLNFPAVKLSLVSLVLAVGIFSLSSCKKDKDDNIDSDLDTSISWPSQWVLATECDSENYNYIYSNVSQILYKGGVPKSYSTKSLTEENDCYFQFSPVAGAGNNVFTIRSYQNQDYWWGVYKTNSPFGAEEWYLGADEDDDFPTDDNLRFILHFMAKQVGKNMIALKVIQKEDITSSFWGTPLAATACRLLSMTNPKMPHILRC